jgi:hypothetical protein
MPQKRLPTPWQSDMIATGLRPLLRRLRRRPRSAAEMAFSDISAARCGGAQGQNKRQSNGDIVEEAMSGQEVAADYKELYIAFLDLLGFKSQVEDAESDPAAHDKLRTVLDLVRKSLCEVPSINFRLNYFSDCIVLSGERTPQGLWEMFNSICTLTSNLMQHDVLIRGGVAAGPVHHSRDFLYGSAYNRAYKLESEVAHDPIVLLSYEVLEDTRKYGDQHMRFLMERGGRWFVNFLLQYALYRPTPIYSGKVCLERPGARVINFISQRLTRIRARFERKRSGYVRTGTKR